MEILEQPDFRDQREFKEIKDLGILEFKDYRVGREFKGIPEFRGSEDSKEIKETLEFRESEDSKDYRESLELLEFRERLLLQVLFLAILQQTNHITFRITEVFSLT